MFTLQVLDRGQTFFYSPSDHAVTLGSGDGVDLRLGESDVAAVHARIEPRNGGLFLVGLEPVVINGETVESAELRLGDRIELGKAILVVGQSVARVASPDDVLGAPRGRSGRSAAPRRSRAPLVIAGLIVAGVVTMAILNSDDAGEVRGQLSMIEVAVGKGDFEAARDYIAASRRLWAGAQDDRLDRLDAQEQKIEAILASRADLERRVLDPASGAYASWIMELRRLEESGQPAERTAARLVRASLRETIERRSPVAPVGGQEDPVGLGRPSSSETGPQDEADSVAASLADASRLAGQGLFAQALALLEVELGQVSNADELAQLRRHSEVLHAEARASARQLIAEAEADVAAGRSRDAVTMLALARHRYPASGEFDVLSVKLREIENSMAVGADADSAPAPASDAPVVLPVAAGVPAAEVEAPVLAGVDDSKAPERRSGLEALRVLLDRVSDAESIGDYVTAARLLWEAADAARSRDADFAARLGLRAERSELCAALHESVAAALGSGRRLRAVSRAGEDLVLVAVAGPRFSTAGDDAHVTWADVSATGIMFLVEQVGIAGKPALGGAAMIYGLGDTVLAEDLLAKALRADPGLKNEIDRIIARGRGESYDERGYELGADGFVSVRELEQRKEAAKIARRIDAAFRGGDEQREQFLTALLARGPDMLDAVIWAFEADLGRQVDKLESSALRKKVSRLEEHRDELDRVRKHAKDLIYDTVEYFYPYKPPAVSSERFAEYNRVQAEVNRRTDEVRRVWKDDRVEVSVPSSLRDDLARLEWCASVLRRLGAFDPGDLADIEWARALPVGGKVGIAGYCRTRAERAELDEWRRIEAYNRVTERKLGSSVRELLRITNGYRGMFRHRPLAISPVVCRAALGHAEEMSRLGYFAHMSPTPGRRTPSDRMKSAGYDYGVTENIALNGSALGAHHAWLRSSGHHRNLLNPRHTEIGIGVDGRNWVQNFGSGRAYEESDAFLRAGSTGRAR